MSCYPCANSFRSRLIDHFRPPRAGVNVTMAAGLIAFAPDIDLQRLQRAATQAQIVFCKLLVEGVHCSDRTIAFLWRKITLNSTKVHRLMNSRASARLMSRSLGGLVDVGASSKLLTVRDTLIIFVKAPRSGFVKTRLGKAIGVKAACEAYKIPVRTVLDGVRTIEHVELRFAPDDALEEIEPWLIKSWIATPQGPGDLGEMLARASDK